MSTQGIEGVIIINRDLTFAYVNRSARELLGLPDNVLDNPSQKISRFLRDIDWERIMSEDPQEWQRVSRSEIEVFYPQHRFLLFYLLPYRNELDPDNRLGMATVILQDVTSLRNQARNDIEKERLNAISMLAAGVAHEIGNPLNSLQIHLQLLERYLDRLEGEAAAEARENVEVCLKEVRRLDEIIFSFLKAVRPQPLDLKPALFSKVVEETLPILEPEIRDRGIQVICEFPPDEPRIHLDVGQIKQVIYNIVKNAIQAMSSQGQLTIRIKVNDRGLVVEFQDTGKGIAPDEIGNIFHPYYTTRPDGTGLGMVIVERITREHGANLSIDSEPGKGTCVRIEFPLTSRQPKLLEAPVESVVVEAHDVNLKHEEA